MTEGTTALSARDFNGKVDFMGSSIAYQPEPRLPIASFTTLKKYQSDTLHLLAQILQNPGLRDTDIQRKQAQQIASIKSNEEEPGYTANVAFTRMIFGKRRTAIRRRDRRSRWPSSSRTMCVLLS